VFKRRKRPASLPKDDYSYTEARMVRLGRQLAMSVNEMGVALSEVRLVITLTAGNSGRMVIDGYNGPSDDRLAFDLGRHLNALIGADVFDSVRIEPAAAPKLDD
jgi:hypothetical protein